MDRASMTTAGTGSRSAGMAVGWVICTHTTSFFHQVTPFWWWNLFYGLHTCVFLLSLNDSFPHIFHVKICSLRPRSALRLSHMTKSDAVSCYGSGLINSYSNWSDQTYSTMTKSDSGSGPLACTHTSFFHWVTPLHSFFLMLSPFYCLHMGLPSPVGWTLYTQNYFASWSVLDAHNFFLLSITPEHTQLLCRQIHPRAMHIHNFLLPLGDSWTNTIIFLPDSSCTSTDTVFFFHWVSPNIQNHCPSRCILRQCTQISFFHRITPFNTYIPSFQIRTPHMTSVLSSSFSWLFYKTRNWFHLFSDPPDSRRQLPGGVHFLRWRAIPDGSGGVVGRNPQHLWKD